MDIEVYISQKQIAKRINELAEDIIQDLGTNLYCIVILTGAMVFFVDLMRALQKKGASVEFTSMKLSSYQGKESTGKVTLSLDTEGVDGKKVLIIEDIIDTGLTLNFLQKHFKKKGIKANVCSLLDKNGKRKHKVEAKYIGFEVPDKFLVGYGLDHDGKHRDLPYIGILT